MLIKLCKPEHNLKTSCKTIRFGTLEYYRNLDSNFLISDCEEGVDSYELVNISFPSYQADVNKLFSGMGLKNAQFENCILERTFTNCFVWCCSSVEQLPDKSFSDQFDKSYTSFYEIKDANVFAHELTKLIARNIQLTQIKEESQKKLNGEMIDLGILTFHGPVIYKNTKKGLVDHIGVLQNFEKNLPLELQPVFIKPMRFSDNKEYRFIFILTALNLKCDLDVKPEPLDLIIDKEFKGI